jgi:hypothetical protein
MYQAIADQRLVSCRRELSERNPMSALGHSRHFRDVRVTSALPPITDIRLMGWNGRKVPNIDLALQYVLHKNVGQPGELPHAAMLFKFCLLRELQMQRTYIKWSHYLPPGLLSAARLPQREPSLAVCQE